MHVGQDAEDSRQEEEEWDEDAESGTSGAPGRGYNEIDTGTEESKSTEQTSQPVATGAKVNHDVPFNHKTSVLFRNVHSTGFLHLEMIKIMTRTQA